MPAKKAVKSEKKVLAPKPAKKAKEFKLFVQLNDEVFETETDNLEESIQSFAPEILRTKVIIRVTKDGKTQERMLYAQKGKILFQNRYALEALVRGFLF